jgi:hypothetical protein
MRTRIKVMDLTLRQGDHLRDNLPPEYQISENAVRVCVEFEHHALGYRHVEMPIRAFMALMTRIQRIEQHAEIEEGSAKLPPLPAKWSAPLSGPDRTCDHGLPVVEETPSVFEDGTPVRTYEDGCQSVGPYRNGA